jgi:hypothetical protein
MGWVISVGRFSGGIVPYELVLQHVDQHSPIDVAEVLTIAAQIGLADAVRVLQWKELEDQVFDGKVTLH